MATQDKKELPACPVETTLILIGNNMCPVHPHMSAGRDFFDSLFDVVWPCHRRGWSWASWHCSLWRR